MSYENILQSCDSLEKAAELLAERQIIGRLQSRMTKQAGPSLSGLLAALRSGAADTAGSIVHGVGNTVGSIGGAIGDAAGAVGGAVGDAAGAVGRGVGNTVGSAWNLAKLNPLIAAGGLTGLGVGALRARSRNERDRTPGTVLSDLALGGLLGTGTGTALQAMQRMRPGLAVEPDRSPEAVQAQEAIVDRGAAIEQAAKYRSPEQQAVLAHYYKGRPLAATAAGYTAWEGSAPLRGWAQRQQIMHAPYTGSSDALSAVRKGIDAAAKAKEDAYQAARAAYDKAVAAGSNPPPVARSLEDRAWQRLRRMNDAQLQSTLKALEGRSRWRWNPFGFRPRPLELKVPLSGQAGAKLVGAIPESRLFDMVKGTTESALEKTPKFRPRRFGAGAASTLGLAAVPNIAEWLMELANRANAEAISAKYK